MSDGREKVEELRSRAIKFIEKLFSDDYEEEYVIEDEDGKYYMINEFSMGDNIYYHFAKREDRNDFFFRKLLVENGKEFFIGLDSEEEFEKVLHYEIKMLDALTDEE